VWLNEIQSIITSVKTDNHFFGVKGVLSRITFEGMKELINTNIADFVSMDPQETVKLCD